MGSRKSFPDKVVVGHYGPEGRPAWMDVDWSRHQRWVMVAGRPVNLIDIGSGDTTYVFIHGLSGSWQNWLENLPHFSRLGRCVALDLPGFGESAMPAEKTTISLYARTVDAVLTAVGVDGPVVVIGNSMGGFTGAELAIAFPARVERLVLVSAAGLSIEKLRQDQLMAALYRIDEILRIYTAWMASKADWCSRRSRARRALLNVVCSHPELLRAPFAAEQMKGTGKPGFLPAVEALTTYPISHRLSEIACPTLIVWGDSDRLVPPKDAYAFERLIPDSRVVMYDDTGHCAMFERPEDFNARVEAFVAEGLGTPAVA